MKSKPRILFIVGVLDSGGVSKAMTSLMNVIDRDSYDVTLMVLDDSGPMMTLLPRDLNIVSSPVWRALVSGPRGLKYLAFRKPLLALGHLVKMAVGTFSKARAGIILSRLLPPLDTEYDMIVDFQGQHQLYYMVDKLKAPVKVTFFHNDYSKWPYYYKTDKKYFDKVDRIFTVSEHCVSVMKNMFPEVASKIGLMENISSVDVITRLAEEDISDMRADLPTFLTVGRVTETKGIELALQTASLLSKRGRRFHWYFLGSNPDARYYQSLAEKYGVEGNVTFLGIRTNPYPYMRRATLIVHPSRFEGKSIALDEIKLLLKPAVVTNFSTVADQFVHGYNASISEMNPEALAGAIENLLDSPDLQRCYSDNLLRDRHDNSSEAEKLYRLMCNG